MSFHKQHMYNGQISSGRFWTIGRFFSDVLYKAPYTTTYSSTLTMTNSITNTTTDNNNDNKIIIKKDNNLSSVQSAQAVGSPPRDRVVTGLDPDIVIGHFRKTYFL